jgi:hypothetical protein
MSQADASFTTPPAAPQRRLTPEAEDARGWWDVLLLFVAVCPLFLLLPLVLATDAPVWRHVLVLIGVTALAPAALFAAPALRLIARGLLALARVLEGRRDD